MDTVKLRHNSTIPKENHQKEDRKSFKDSKRTTRFLWSSWDQKEQRKGLYVRGLLLAVKSFIFSSCVSFLAEFKFKTRQNVRATIGIFTIIFFFSYFIWSWLAFSKRLTTHCCIILMTSTKSKALFEWRGVRRKMDWVRGWIENVPVWWIMMEVKRLG